MATIIPRVIENYRNFLCYKKYFNRETRRTNKTWVENYCILLVLWWLLLIDKISGIFL